MGKKKKIATLTRENLRLRIELFRSRKMGSLKGVAWESMNGGLLESMRMLERGENPAVLLREWEQKLLEAGEANLADDFDDYAALAENLL